MDIRVLLYQTGYLTLKNYKKDTFYFKFPNQEILSSFKSLYFTNMYKDIAKRDELESCALKKLSSAQDIVAYFNRILNAVDYES